MVHVESPESILGERGWKVEGSSTSIVILGVNPTNGDLAGALAVDVSGSSSRRLFCSPINGRSNNCGVACAAAVAGRTVAIGQPRC